MCGPKSTDVHTIRNMLGVCTCVSFVLGTDGNCANCGGGSPYTFPQPQGTTPVFPLIPPTHAPVGWVCPVCSAGVAPWMSTCPLPHYAQGWTSTGVETNENNSDD